ncbi:tyrosine-type recombinase/integrase [Paenibacillus urinalis]|uniref:Tyrosine-type recombinase/integrase n=1 Tax=Paenibacillus urinalis TaxID=521520 RepID=A0AAX3N1A1_9BACL|nr:tyrosine-type recombinase/integrase [Paenibacillus urinalis]WDH83297.1 tyrosine-type recombinase/integrase [Paenibacillus urinalis]
MDNILLQSHYFTFWFEHISLTSKEDVITYLKKFEAFLVLKGFEGKLDFDHFHGSREYPDKFLPIRETVIDQFVIYLRNECNASTYVLYNAISSLKNFFAFLYEMELIQHNPMLDYPNPYYHRPIKNTALSKEECLALLHTALKKDPFYRQEFVLVWFMLITGLRNSEVRLLRRSKINLDHRMVRINEGQKTESRLAAITTALAKEIKRYIDHPIYRKSDNNGDEFLFNHAGKEMSSTTLCNLIKNLSHEAGITRTITPHDLRRTSGYLMQAGGMNIIEVQKQLGHKILSTTMRYVPPLVDLAKILESLDE